MAGGNIYYQVVLGLAPRPRSLSRGTAIAAGGTAAVAGGVASARHVAAEAVDKAGAGHLAQAPLANPAVAPNAAASAGGATTPGTTAAPKTGTHYITRSSHHVTGAADPHSRNAWFTQGLTEGPVGTGTITQGKVSFPTCVSRASIRSSLGRLALARLPTRHVMRRVRQRAPHRDVRDQTSDEPSDQRTWTAQPASPC